MDLLFPGAIVGVIVSALAAGVVTFRRGRRVKEHLFHRCHCPACGQRMRFAPAKIGRPAQCPRCATLFNLPRDTEPSTCEPHPRRKRAKPIGTRV